MKRPLLVIVLGYIIGIVWGLYCKCSIALFYAIIIPSYVIAKKVTKSKRKFKIFSIKRYYRYIKIFLKSNTVLTIIVSSFISNCFVIYQNNKYYNLYSNLNKVDLVGVIISNIQEKEYKKVCIIKIQSINGQIKYKDTFLLLNIKKSDNTKIEYGDKINVRGFFKEPNQKRNYKGFDYKSYLKTKKIYGTVDTNKIEVINQKSINTIFLISNKCQIFIKNHIKKILPEEYSNLLIAIILGDKDNIDETTIENFRESSMAHVLAISGMHITYIILGITKIMDLILGKKKSKIVAVIFIIIYMFITGFSPSIVRAVLMGTAIMISKIIYRKNDIWNMLAFSLFCILLYNPFLITDIGLLLSYGGVVGILIFYKNISRLFNNIKIKERNYKYIIKKFEKQKKYIIDAFAFSISIQLAIAPIIVSCFNMISFSFFITNLFLSVIMAPIIILGFITIIISISISWIGQFIKYPLILLLKSLIIISKIGRMLPFNKIYIVTPSIIEILLYYSIILFINLIYKIYISKDHSSFKFRIRNIISLIRYKIKLNKKKIISSIIIICLIFETFRFLPGKLHIHFIDVGQGDSTLITTPMKKSVLIDGGGSQDSSFDVGKNILLPYLLDRKIKKIDYIIISHMDQDHVRWNIGYNRRIKSEKHYY